MSFEIEGGVLSYEYGGFGQRRENRKEEMRERKKKERKRKAQRERGRQISL